MIVVTLYLTNQTWDPTFILHAMTAVSVEEQQVKLYICLTTDILGVTGTTGEASTSGTTGTTGKVTTGTTGTTGKVTTGTTGEASTTGQSTGSTTGSTTGRKGNFLFILIYKSF